MHNHVAFESGRTKAAQIYPPGLCMAICLGFKEQVDADRRGQFHLMNMNSNPENDVPLMKSAEKFNEKHITVVERNEEEMEEAWDDLSGEVLDPMQVKIARQEHLDRIHKMGLCSEMQIYE